MNINSDSSNPFAEVTLSVRPLFSEFRKYLAKQAASFEPEVRNAAKEAILPEGKYIRPALVFVSAAGCADKKSVVRRAAIAELVHLSTLIHDDVIDCAQLRRNRETANKKYGAKTAILLGDAIFSHMMTLAFEENDMEVLRKTAKCVRTICEGEIKQTLADSSKTVSRKKYYDIAYGKTAALFELACALGASAGNPPKGWETAASQAGKQLGIAYQIYDDVCDWFMSEADAGKTLGTDLITGKQTYPLIILLEKLSAAESKKLAANLPCSSPEKIAEQMRRLNIAADCAKEFRRRVDAAEKILKNFPNENAGLLKFCAAMRGLKVG